MRMTDTVTDTDTDTDTINNFISSGFVKGSYLFC